MSYQIVFDVVQNGFTGWTEALFPLIFSAVGVGLFFKRDRVRMRDGRSMPKQFALGLIAAGLLFSGGILWMGYGAYQQAAAHLQNGNYKVIEGAVRDFQQGGSPGKYFESFRVADKDFSYYGSVSNHGFHRLAIDGGPIREGLPVRIAYFGGTILRLEIAR